MFVKSLISKSPRYCKACDQTHVVSQDRTFLRQIFPTLEHKVQQLLLLHKISEKSVPNCVALQTITLS